MRKGRLRRGGLFFRMFSAFSVTILAIIVVFTGILAMSLQQARQSSYENEVLSQAREVASYMSYMNQLSYFSQDTSMRYFISEKITSIRDDYQADIWLVSYASGRVQCLDSNLNTSEVTLSGPVFELLQEIRSGKEMRAQGIFQELGSNIVTIGVPWKYAGKVVGAVLLHISVESLRVHYGQLLWQLAPTALLALVLGMVLCWWVTVSQTRPIRDINLAMRDFGQGKSERRIHLDCGGEVQELGESFNRMADELERQEETRRSFVANVSHELRSPLTSMRGYVEALLDGTISPEDSHRYLQVVMDETMRLTDLVRDLLDLSRIESGKFPLNKSAFDMCELMRRTLINYAQRIDRKNAHVEAEIPDVPCFVEADVNRISQVLSNIVDNAVKFLPETGGVLKLGVEKLDANVSIWVQDNGSGIAPEDMPHIFERFYKADKAHTAGMGTGLGLAICQRILEQHGSKIEARSKPGETVFSFSLPAVDAPARIEPPREKSES